MSSSTLNRLSLCCTETGAARLADTRARAMARIRRQRKPPRPVQGLRFISNRQWRNAVTFLCGGVGGGRTLAARPSGAGYARLCQLG
jgi:hypothetical protein